MADDIKESPANKAGCVAAGKLIHAELSVVQILTPGLGVNRAMVWSWSSSCLDWLSEDSGENPILS